MPAMDDEQQAQDNVSWVENDVAGYLSGAVARTVSDHLVDVTG
jgi:hypothetical protein